VVRVRATIGSSELPLGAFSPWLDRTERFLTPLVNEIRSRLVEQAAGRRTVLVVDEYLYAPRQGKLKLGSRLAKGTLNYVSGSIAKLKPEAVSVNTPTGTIGVRGTQFVARVGPAAER
jgi:hypothetical protein